MATLHVRNVPDELYDALRERAEGEGRSIGSETIAILEEALRRGVRRGLRRRLRSPSVGPFQRFTGDARRVVVAAQREAASLGHGSIGEEHILLGLLDDAERPAGRALASLGVTLPAVRARAAQRVDPRETPPGGQVPFSPEARKVLELSLREALALGDNYVGTEHVLLGLVRRSEGSATRILRDLGADPETVRDTVLGALGEGGGEALLEAWEPPVTKAGDERAEYRAVRLEGSADGWTETLNALAGDGWRLFSITSEAGETRAVLHRGG